VFAVECDTSWQHSMRVGPRQPAGIGLQEGVEPDHDRRAAWILHGGAKLDKRDTLGVCDGEEQEGIR
jgi:hypothetical protein